MSGNTNHFDIALGQCFVQDGTLVIDRLDPENIGRGELFWRGVSTNLEYRPVVTVVRLIVILLLGLIFGSLLVYLYSANPAVAPLVAGLGALGVLAIIVPMEVTYRRLLSQRRDIRVPLEDEFELVQAERIPLNEITHVTVRPISTGLLLDDGHLFLIHFQHGGKDVTTYIGFPEFMSAEQTTALTLFERYDIPIENEKKV